MRIRHYAVRTERAYVGWIQRFVLSVGGWNKDLSNVGEMQVKKFLGNLAVEDRVAASTQNQAFSLPSQQLDFLLCTEKQSPLVSNHSSGFKWKNTSIDLKSRRKTR